MDAKLLAVLLAILGTLSVFYTKGQAEVELTEFQQWKI
jgi:hypothetical protein